MSEEIRKAGTELNEAALSGVSGGKSHPEEAISEAAHGYCLMCEPGHCTATRFNSLYDYMKQNGKDSVKGPQSCPYYRR